MLTRDLLRPLRNWLRKPSSPPVAAPAPAPAAPPPRPFSLEPMWFLSASADAVERAPISTTAKQALRDLRDNGFAILPGHVPAPMCDAVVRDFEAYCAATPESADYRDDFSLHERLALLHLVSDAAVAVLSHPPTTEILTAAFDTAPTIVGSLFFEKGSTQSIHRDTPAFFTNPLNHFLGVWHALEDVVEGAGALTYFEKGHLVARDIDLYRDETVTKDTYFKVVRDACLAAGLRQLAFHPKKGDVVIWHPELPHGGAPITKPGTSRRSLVGHFIPEGTPMLRPEDFFGKGDPGSGTLYPIRRHGRATMLDLGAPRFFHNVYEGNFDEI